jgi:hypothetical protein
MADQADVDACRSWLHEVVELDCRSGFYDEANIREAIAEIIELELGEPHPALFDEIAARVSPRLAARAREEELWQDRTVNDRLDAAFEDLDARGIVARQLLGFTVQEGASLIDELCAASPGARGSVFYHRQDLERGVRGEGLFLAFAPREENPAAWLAIGHEIVHVIKHHGAPVQWDGDLNQRIKIAPFEWRKRRVTRAPPSTDAVAPPYQPARPPAVCGICQGKGWLPQLKESDFPRRCECQKR